MADDTTRISFPASQVPVKSTAGKEKPVPESIKGTTFNLDPSAFGTAPIEVKEEHGGVKTNDEQLKVKSEVKKDEVKSEVKKEEKKETKSEKEGVKTEEKKEESLFKRLSKAPSEEKKEEVKGDSTKLDQQVKISDAKKTRDLTGFTPDEQKHLTQMSNEAFEWASQLAKENKELKPLRESQYYQHENGYLLDPDYLNQVNSLQRALIEEQCWDRTLSDLKKNGKAMCIIGFDPKNGSPVMGGYDANGNPVKGLEMEGTDALERNITKVSLGVSQEVQKLQSNLQTYPAKYKDRVKNDLQAINQYRSNFFEWAADPKLMDNTVTIPGLGEVPLKKISSDFKSLLPTYMRSHPLADVCADLLIFARLQGSAMADLRTTTEQARTLVVENKRAEPSTDVVPENKDITGKSINGSPKVFTTEGMPK
jgi:hypothetical protein